MQQLSAMDIADEKLAVLEEWGLTAAGKTLIQSHGTHRCAAGGRDRWVPVDALHAIPPLSQVLRSS